MWQTWSVDVSSCSIISSMNTTSHLSNPLLTNEERTLQWSRKIFLQISTDIFVHFRIKKNNRGIARAQLKILYTQFVVLFSSWTRLFSIMDSNRWENGPWPKWNNYVLKTANIVMIMLTKIRAQCSNLYTKNILWCYGWFCWMLITQMADKLSSYVGHSIAIISMHKIFI